MPTPGRGEQRDAARGRTPTMHARAEQGKRKPHPPTDPRGDGLDTEPGPTPQRGTARVPQPRRPGWRGGGGEGRGTSPPGGHGEGGPHGSAMGAHERGHPPTGHRTSGLPRSDALASPPYCHRQTFRHRKSPAPALSVDPPHLASLTSSKHAQRIPRTPSILPELSPNLYYHEQRKYIAHPMYITQGLIPPQVAQDNPLSRLQSPPRIVTSAHPTLLLDLIRLQSLPITSPSVGDSPQEPSSTPQEHCSKTAERRPDFCTQTSRTSSPRTPPCWAQPLLFLDSAAPLQKALLSYLQELGSPMVQRVPLKGLPEGAPKRVSHQSLLSGVFLLELTNFLPSAAPPFIA